MLCGAITAHAGGLNLSWDHCFADGSPVSNKSFACVSSVGEETLVSSFIPAVPLSGMVHLDASLEVQAAAPSAIPAWLLPGGCAESALQPGGFLPGSDVNCHDWTNIGGAGVTITGYNYPAGDARQERIGFASSISFPGSPVEANVEYLAFRVRISHNALAGPGTCGGCSTPLTIALNLVRGSSGPNSFTLLLPVSGSSNRVEWQAAGGPTAARNTSWSAVKSLYR